MKVLFLELEVSKNLLFLKGSQELILKYTTVVVWSKHRALYILGKQSLISKNIF